MPDEPDLFRELDAAEAIAMGGATVVTEWGEIFARRGNGSPSAAVTGEDERRG